MENKLEKKSSICIQNLFFQINKNVIFFRNILINKKIKEINISDKKVKLLIIASNNKMNR
jgi:hypothetical protein